jgi:hypothetical protein
MAHAHFDRFMASLTGEEKKIAERLRKLVHEAAPELEEDFKWNAPSYRLGDMHCMTLGRVKNGGVRIVLHLDSKARPTAGFKFDDPDAVARWPAPDRGVAAFATEGELVESRTELRSLIARWVDAARAVSAL